MLSFKKISFIIVSIFIVAIAVFSSCGSDDEGPAPVEHARHTLVAYMMVDGLDGYIKANVKDIIEASKGIPAYENILAFLDYTGSDSYILKITQGKVDTVRNYNRNLINSDPEVMTEVLQWCFDNYPADNYGLMFGSHGSSCFFSNDTIAKGKKTAIGASYDNDKPINIPTFAKVLESLPHQQYILLDLCAGQSVEVAYEIKNSTDYIIGSPAEIPDSGAQFKAILPYMFKDSPIEIGRQYYEYYKKKSTSLPVSVIKTSELENLAYKTKENLHFISSEFPAALNFDGLVYYFASSKSSYAMPLCYDMNNIMLEYLPTENYNSWKEQLDKTVVYKGISSRWTTVYPIKFNSFTVNEQTYGGVSMFVPLTMYNQSSLNSDYNKLLWYHAVYE